MNCRENIACALSVLLFCVGLFFVIWMTAMYTAASSYGCAASSWFSGVGCMLYAVILTNEAAR